jgi:hypothetical protein
MFFKTLEQLHIYKNAKLKINLNDICCDVYNFIFDATLKYEMVQQSYTTH